MKQTKIGNSIIYSSVSNSCQCRNLILFVLQILLLAGCSGENFNKGVFRSVREIKGECMGIGDLLGRPYALYAMDDKLIIRNKGLETELLLVDLSNLDSPLYFGKKGEGPDEFVNVGVVLVEHNSFSIYDNQKHRMMKYECLEDSLSSPELVFDTTTRGIMYMAKLSDSLYFSTGVFEGGRYCLLNGQGQMLKYWGNFPIDETMDIPFHVKGMAFQSNVCANSSKSRVAVAMRYGGVVQFYDINPTTKQISEINSGISTFYPSFKTQEVNGTPNFSPNETTQWGYINICSTEKYVYALYSGRTQVRGEPFYCGNTIHVFDWDGNPIQEIKLDKDVQYISSSNNKIYALFEDKENGYDLISYDL